MAKLKATTYKELRELHGDFGTPKFRDTVTIGNNTKSEHHGYYQFGACYITLHGHRIVMVTPRTVAFTLTGWPTVTTRERINQFLPDGFGVYQAGYRQWFKTPTGTFEIEDDLWYDCKDYV